jgi:sorting and assembly machinery component 37
MLRWPHQWFIPHKLRDDAKIRSEHLGLSSLDIDTVSKENNDTSVRGAGNIPTNLVAKPKETVASMLGKSGRQNQFRLDVITSDVFEPLCELVEKNGSHSWLFGTDQATSLDCLLLGHMSLMAAPLTPPHQWLQDALSSKFPALLQWTTSFRQECFGVPIRATDVLSAPHPSRSLVTGSLPWHPRAPVSIKSTGLTVLTATFHSLSTFFPYRSDQVIRTSSQHANAGGSGDTFAGVRLANFPLYGQFGVGLGGSVIGAALGYFLWVGRFSPRERAHTMPARQATTSQRGFGEAGRILGLG